MYGRLYLTLYRSQVYGFECASSHSSVWICEDLALDAQYRSCW